VYFQYLTLTCPWKILKWRRRIDSYNTSDKNTIVNFKCHHLQILTLQTGWKFSCIAQCKQFVCICVGMGNGNIITTSLEEFSAHLSVWIWTFVSAENISLSFEPYTGYGIRERRRDEIWIWTFIPLALALGRTTSWKLIRDRKQFFTTPAEIITRIIIDG
jgi:hypothetical protein